MHQYKTIAKTLLVLSILNLAFAAPVVPQEVRDTGNGAVVVAEDVTNGSDRRRGTDTPVTPPGGTSGTTPSQYPPSLSDESLSAGWNKLYQKTNKLNTEASTSAHPLSAAGGPASVPVPDSTTEASTSAHPLSAADGPAHVPDSITEAPTSPDTGRPVSLPDSTAQGSTTPHYTAITPEMLIKNEKWYEKPIAKEVAKGVAGEIALLAIIGGATAGIWKLSSFLNKNEDD
jgi:hypothetical protein